MPNSFILTTQDQLDEFCRAAAGSAFVALDTEFLREKTYWPKLCLVQMAFPGRAAILDPLTIDLDWTPFFKLLQNPDVVKVLHSGRQDLEIIWKMTGFVPHPVYDTQVAAMVCGYGESIGYDRLAQAVLNIKIDKNSQYTDWSRRPLSEKQLRYAAGDVIHLSEIYPVLKKRIDDAGRGHWIEEEMQTLIDPATYEAQPDLIWKRLKFRSHNRRAHAAFRLLAAWRETEAQRRDLPRGFILRDESLQEIASHMPHSASELESIRGLPGKFAEGVFGEKVLEIIRTTQAIPQPELPQIDRDHNSSRPNYSSSLDLLRVLLRHISDQEKVAGKLIAVTDDLEVLACGEDEDIPCLHGWRYELFGRHAEALMQGKIALSLKKGEIEIVEV